MRENFLFQPLLAVLLALVLFLHASGMQVTASPSSQPFPQALLLAQMTGGAAIAPVLPAVVWLHPVRGADVGFAGSGYRGPREQGVSMPLTDVAGASATSAR